MSEIETNTLNNEPKSSGMATASLVLGIIGVVLFLLPHVAIILDILAIIFGAIVINKAKTEPIKNRGSAKAGLILGIVGVVIDILMIVLAVSFFANFMSSYPNLQ